MKRKNEKDSSSARRVGAYIKKENQPLLDESSISPAKSHAYKWEHPSLVPDGIDQITPNQPAGNTKPIREAKVILQKTPRPALEQLQCTANQKSPLFFIEKAEAFRAKTIQNFKYKEQIIAKRGIKKLSLEMQRWIYMTIHHEFKVLGKDAEEFYQLIERREERHFQIDRIIKYLSN
ncbi:MAG: hypothetical protein KR126chlam1_01373 [Chlamydiae bacterium]|nr:hypothetical protein [Chlamydiota bacterium]